VSRARTLAVLAALLLAAALCGLLSIWSPLGRDFSGYQSSFFALSASQYDKHGLTRWNGYPALEEGSPCIGGVDDLVQARDAQGAALVYRNHPPTAFWLGYFGVAATGGDFHSPLRHRMAALPFLAAHLLTLLALWWWLAAPFGASRALLGTLAAASTPIALHSGALPNLENPALPGVVFALGAWARWQAEPRARWLVFSALGLAAASSVTFAPLFFAATMALATANRRAGALLVGAALLPLLLHAWNAQPLGALNTVPLSSRPLELVRPMFDGTLSPWRWLLIQVQHLAQSAGLPWLIVGLAGAWFAPRRALCALAGGLLLYWLAFYRHTAEEQWQFQLWITPLVGLCAAAVLARLPQRTAWISALALAACGAFGALRMENRLQQHALPAPEPSAQALRALVPRGATALLPDAAGQDLSYAYQSDRDLRPASHEAQGTRRASLRLEWDPQRGWHCPR
jgi:hypothetical protein